MQITINVNAPELAQAIQTLAASLQAVQAPPQQSISVESLAPIRPPAPVTDQVAAPTSTAPVSQSTAQQAPVSQAATPAQPTQSAQQAPTQQAPAAAPTSAPTYDFNQIASATMQLQDAGHNIFELLSQFGIQALNQLPKERYGEYANALRERGAKL